MNEMGKKENNKTIKSRIIFLIIAGFSHDFHHRMEKENLITTTKYLSIMRKKIFMSLKSSWL
jgi:hypothetical protein